MSRLIVLYSTRDKHTAEIARRIATDLRIRGFDAEEHDLRSDFPDTELDGYRCAIVAGSLQPGRNEPELVRFVQENLEQLERMCTQFVSVALSEAGADAEFATDVDEAIGRFVKETGWQPGRIRPLVGAIRHTQHNILVRLIIRSMAKRAGATTDTLSDYRFTDWIDLDLFVEEIADDVAASCTTVFPIPPVAFGRE